MSTLTKTVRNADARSLRCGILFDERHMKILTLNTGSSSIKSALYDTASGEREFLLAIARIGESEASLAFTTGSGTKESLTIVAPDFDTALAVFHDRLLRALGDGGLDAIAHRVVYGSPFSDHGLITDEMMTTLEASIRFDPDHLPQEIAAIAAMRLAFPTVQQVACFDTVFHNTMPRVAKLVPVPRRYLDAGLVRSGFHGLSYSYLIDKLEETAGAEVAHGRVVIAHLGSGASLAAIKDKKSVETSMGFTPAGGVPMGTRSGDIDPGVARFIMEHDMVTAATLSDILNTQSGLLGVSGTHAHMYPLIMTEATDPHAKEAVDMFVHAVRKTIGAYAAVLGGLDALVFSGGMGEPSEPIRRKVCTDLEFLGIEIDPARNLAHDTRISTDKSAVSVYVLPTNEEAAMAAIAERIARAPR